MVMTHRHRVGILVRGGMNDAVFQNRLLCLNGLAVELSRQSGVDEVSLADRRG